MKIKLIILGVLSSILITLAIFFIKPLDEGKQVKEQIKTEEYKTLTYLITEVNGSEYYGQSIDGKTKIYFNSEKMKYPMKDRLEINDKIIAFVEPENHVGGLVKVEKIIKKD
ncbi:hypothetical protein [Metabacillus litoralis]|uniref:hypothetical protein n=1 Tax=Metabacillus litoralis TaxID=152268 RepID=UPI001CFE1EE4|nr:hypothetical protein [Metabacillus litoralis]